MSFDLTAQTESRPYTCQDCGTDLVFQESLSACGIGDYGARRVVIHVCPACGGRRVFTDRGGSVEVWFHSTMAAQSGDPAEGGERRPGFGSERDGAC